MKLPEIAVAVGTVGLFVSTCMLLTDQVTSAVRYGPLVIASAMVFAAGLVASRLGERR